MSGEPWMIQPGATDAQLSTFVCTSDQFNSNIERMIDGAGLPPDVDRERVRGSIIHQLLCVIVPAGHC